MDGDKAVLQRYLQSGRNALPWFDDEAEPDADMWATADESREEVVAFYRRVWVHSDATIESLPLDAIGQVTHRPPERRDVVWTRSAPFGHRGIRGQYQRQQRS
jgi:hypothetical protein